MTQPTEHPPKSYMGRLGAGFAILGVCVALGVVAFCVFMYWLATHFMAGFD